MAVLLGYDFSNVVYAADNDVSPGDDPANFIEAQSDDTLVVLDGGDYPLGERIDINNDIGITTRRNRDTSEIKAVFELEDGFGGVCIDADASRRFAMDGIHLDMTPANTWGDLVLSADDWHVRDLRVIGRADPDYPDSGPFITPEVTAADGRGTVEGVDIPEGYDFERGRTQSMQNAGGADDGSAKDDWTRQAILVHRGLDHVGTLRVTNCRFEEFGSHAIYASATNGDVQVEKTVFANCDNTTGVRYHGNGGNSWVRDCLSVLDPAAASFDPGLFRYLKAHWVEAKSNVDDSSGARIENCRVEATDHPQNSDLLQSRKDGPDWEIRNCELIGGPNMAAIAADDPTDKQGSMDQHTEIVVEDTKIVGCDPAITVENRPDSTATDVCVEGGGSISGVFETGTDRGSCPAVTSLPRNLGPLRYQQSVRYRIEGVDIHEHDGLLDPGDTGINDDRTIATGSIADLTDLDAVSALSSKPISIFASAPDQLDATVNGQSVPVYAFGETPPDGGSTGGAGKSILSLTGDGGTKWYVRGSEIEERDGTLEDNDAINGERTFAEGSIANSDDEDTLAVAPDQSVSVAASDPDGLSATLDGSPIPIDPVASGDQPRDYAAIVLAAASGRLNIVRDQDSRQ